MTDIRELDRRAVEATGAFLATAGPADLALPTPCAGWTLRDLAEHLVGQNHGFAAAARGEGADLAVWRPRPVGDDPADAYRASADDVIAAFAADGALDSGWALPEIRDGGTFPGRIGISFHFVDYVVHAWDVAATLRLDPMADAEGSAGLDPELVAAALPVAERVPDDPESRAPGRAFRPSLRTGPDDQALHRLLRLLGRDPAWKPPTG
ncbi:MAG: TIGR03086 family metal-binding protein [Mycobacteriales bacterium]